MNNYTILHLHTDMSNPTTVLDSVTKYKVYVDKAKSLGMTGMSFSEHGNICSWYNKKKYCESNNIKYIHSCEAYITFNENEKIKDNFHCLLIATNKKSFKELNKLVSKSFSRKDNHFYHTPRIFYSELINTSEDIIILTGCVAGILGKEHENRDLFIDFLIKNKHRCYLEFQYHMASLQLTYNEYLYDLHKKYNIPIVITTDTHSLDEDASKGRLILQQSKNIHFDNEDEWDTTFKTYEELYDLMKKQNILSEEDILIGLENTNIIANKVEKFDIDISIKYPKIYEDSENVLKKRILEGWKYRNIDNKVNKDEYFNRVRKEFKVYKNNNVIDFILLEDNIKSWCRKNDIAYGCARGSVSGSIIAYLLQVTDIDSVKENLIFERFLNSERISLSDVDSDYEPSKRHLVKKYIHEDLGLNCAEIIAYHTIAEKGSIRDVGRAFNIDLSIINDVCNNIENESEVEKYKKQYPDLFKYSKMLEGTIVSYAIHAAGSILTDYNLEEEVGLMSSATCDYSISCLDMKEIDSMNYVKLDILGLDTIEVISNTCKDVNISMLLPENLDINDMNIWNEIKLNPIGIFQWETVSGWKYYLKLFSEETIMKLKKINPNMSYLDLFSIGNGCIRPAGESYRDKLANGEGFDNGNDIINNALKDTFGYQVYQENFLMFLNKFCDFTLGEADGVRRGFAKKTGTEKFVPKIKEGFIKTVKEKYNMKDEDAEKSIESFIKIVISSSDYLFSLNHSVSYSYIGAMCAYLRHYYPLEFLTNLLNNQENDLEYSKNIIEFLPIKNIKLDGIKFRKSNAKYSFDKNENIIYKGLSSIKCLNDICANGLYSLKDNTYSSFYQLINDIYTNKIANTRQLNILILLDYFSEFGKSKYLLDIESLYQQFNDKKIFKKDKLSPELTDLIRKYSQHETAKQFSQVDIESVLKELISKIPNIDIPIKDKIIAELEYVGYAYSKDKCDKNICMISDINTERKNPILTLYYLNSGESIKIKIKSKLYEESGIKLYNLIKVLEVSEEFKWIVDGKDDKGKLRFKRSGEKENILTIFKILS